MKVKDHVDPKNSKHICGLNVEENFESIDFHQNSWKTDRFVPYRISGIPAPKKFGDFAEFLIEGSWVVCEFGGELWAKESKRIGFSATQPASEKQKETARKVCSELGKRAGQRNKESGRMAVLNQLAAEARKNQVFVFDTFTGETYEFDSQIETCKTLDLSPGLVSAVLNGHKETTKGYAISWK